MSDPDEVRRAVRAVAYLLLTDLALALAALGVLVWVARR